MEPSVWQPSPLTAKGLHGVNVDFRQPLLGDLTDVSDLSDREKTIYNKSGCTSAIQDSTEKPKTHPLLEWANGVSFGHLR